MLRRAAARRHLRQAYGNIAAPRDAIIDVEAVVLDTKGRPDFAVLEASLAADGQKAIAWVFELLFLHERDLRALPLGERREAFEELIGRGTDAILLSEQRAPDGDEFFEIARAHGLEGIVSKRVDRTYRSGKRREWLKTKAFTRMSLSLSAISRRSRLDR